MCGPQPVIWSRSGRINVLDVRMGRGGVRGGEGGGRAVEQAEEMRQTARESVRMGCVGR